MCMFLRNITGNKQTGPRSACFRRLTHVRKVGSLAYRYLVLVKFSTSSVFKLKVKFANLTVIQLLRTLKHYFCFVFASQQFTLGCRICRIVRDLDRHFQGQNSTTFTIITQRLSFGYTFGSQQAVSGPDRRCPCP